jgi:DNA-binding response OmpR family regulator
VRASVQVLLVEDEAHLADGIRFNLEQEGFAVEVLGDGQKALERLTGPSAGSPVDLLILDVMLPGKDGFAVARELRGVGDFTPVLMLTAKGLPEDMVQGLEAGADDYLAKPFDLEVFLARVKGLLRRRDWTRAGNGSQRPRIGPAEVDFKAFEIHVGAEVTRLTLLEAMLLKLLYENAGRVVSKGAILEKVWNLHPDTETRAVDNFIVRLRRYLHDDPRAPRYLVTVRGAGYRLDP